MSIILIISSCKFARNNSGHSVNERNKEAREDSIKLADAYARQSNIKPEVNPIAETDPVIDHPQEDAADDPAVWLNPHAPENSLIFGTNKKSGIYSYDLSGHQIEFYQLGKINNIDIRNRIRVGDKYMDILGGSNRSDNSIILYEIDSIGKLNNLLSQNYTIDTLDIDEVYGFCLYKDEHGQARILVNGKNGKVNQYLLVAGETHNPELIYLNSWKLDSQPEGMVADDAYGDLYIGEEEKGIWKLSLKKPELPPNLLQDSQKAFNPDIEYDIEGLALYSQPNGTGFLVASIQGSFSYAIFDRVDNRYLGSFKISPSDEIDGVEETDGIEIISHTFPGFERGIMIVQDGFNYRGPELIGQNFKYVSMDKVLKIVGDLRSEKSSEDPN
ncbi:MAG: phytase [Cytophagales bacterium]|nr:phytase [Cytophagales bacterium]